MVLQEPMRLQEPWVLQGSMTLESMALAAQPQAGLEPTA
jgi:hypothetical protein